MKSYNRRTILQTAAAASAAPAIWTSRTGHAAQNGGKPKRLNVAAIGTSIYEDRYTGKGEFPGRGAVVGHQAGERADMVAVADVNTRNAAFFAERYNGNCKTYRDYREMLDAEDIDAVTIGTPDHWHAKIAIDCLRAGKHVYCEKPLTLTIREGQQICKVVEETGLTFQVGTQQRSEFDNIFLHAVAIAQSGMLGDKLDCLISVGPGESGGPFPHVAPPETLDWEMWQGQTPDVPYIKQRCDYDFRWWLEYSGGQVTDWGVHHGDIAMWAMGLDNSGPTKIEGKGTYPDVENGFNVATEFDCHYEFPGGHTARLYSGRNELIISGSGGRIRVNRGGLTGLPAEKLGVATSGKDDWSKDAADKSGKGPQWLQDKVADLCHGKPAGSHMDNFFACIADGGKPISDVWSHHRSVSLCHLANIAMILDRPLTWDPESESFADDEQANAMRSRPQREGYEIDVEVG